MINYKVEIYSEEYRKYIDYTEYAIFPLKIAELLDEQLDESNITLK